MEKKKIILIDECVVYEISKDMTEKIIGEIVKNAMYEAHIINEKRRPGKISGWLGSTMRKMFAM